jgi:hypothetical protein
MITKIFVFEFPSLMDEITSIFEDTFEKPRAKKCNFKRDLTPPKFKVRNELGKAPLPEWGIGGEEADDNLRFGAEFAVDEPRREDYDCRWEFEDDHKAYDKFVEVGEDCIARGLGRPNGVTPHKCNAVRKRLDEAPPMNLNLIGETHWWDEDLDWCY